MAINIPYMSICNAVGSDTRGQFHRRADSVYGKALHDLQVGNTLEFRTLIKQIVTFCIEEIELLDSNTLSPQSGFATISDADIKCTIQEELKLKPTNYSVSEHQSVYGQIAAKLGLENTQQTREHIRDITSAWSMELLQSKSHQDIQASFNSAKSQILHPKQAKSIFGEVAMDLNIPNIQTIRCSLSRWRKCFPKDTTIVESADVVTNKQPIVNRRRPRVSSEMQAPPKRTRHHPQLVNDDTEAVSALLPAKIKEFMNAVHKYPEKVCDICCRLQYTLNGHSSSELPENVLQHINPLTPTIQLCDRCQQTLKRKKVPSQASFNNMQQQTVPDEIKSLSQAEIQLISQVRPFMKIFYLSKGRGQQAIKGSAIHFPNSVNNLCQNLPLSNSSSEFVVVHEKIEGLQNQHDFRVRQSAVMNALKWLKENNWLYRNVTICDREENALQPVTVEVDVSRTTVPQKNVPVSMLAYANLGPGKRILRASCHQASEGRFLEAGRGKQCTAMAMTAIAYSSIQAPSTYTTDVLDEILLRGDKLYGARATRGQLLLAMEAQGPIDDVFGAVSVDLIVDESHAQPYNGQLNRLASEMASQVLRLPQGLQNFIDSNHRSAIITVGDYSMSIIKGENTVYFFDSHSRGPHGRIAANGLACIIEFPYLSAAKEISKLIHINLEPKRIPENDERDRWHYLFSIIPIRTETEYVRDEGNRTVENISLPSNSQLDPASPLEDRLSSLLDNAAAFGENVMVDSLLHNVDYNVPEIEDIVPKSNSHTPTINVLKERGRPLYPNQEEHLEELSFVGLFPYGKGGVSAIRSTPITPLDYYQARVMSCDTRFWDNSYLFYALSRMEEHKVKQKIAVCGQMQTLQSNGQNAEYPGLTNVHLYMSAIRGSASYWKKYTGDLIAMIAQRGIPSIFFTMSSDDLNSTDSLCGLLVCEAMRRETNNELMSSLRQFIHGRNYEEIEKLTKSMSYEMKSDLLNRHPVQAARHFNHRVNNFMKLLKNCAKEIFGFEIEDYSYRVEFQNRGSPHIHMLIWFLDAPTDYRSEEGRNFIERNMTCSIPDDDEELKTLVLKYQQHKHTRTCFPRTNFCRFDFPRKVSSETVILDEDDINRNKGRFCILKRNQHETYINNYHPILLKILKCNMDIQFVTDANAIAYYIAKYISKAEPTDIQEEIQKIMQQLQSNSKASYYQMATSIATKIMNKRQVSAPEAAYRLCHLKLRHSSRGFVFVPAYQPSKRLHIIQKETIGNSNAKMGLSLVEKYCMRPANLLEICLLEFASMYSPAKKDSSELDQDNDSGDEEEQFQNSTIRLTNGTIMKMRKRPAIVKYPNFDVIKQAEDYYYSLMLLYYPFLVEEDILNGFPTIMDAFKERSHFFRNSSHADFLRPNLMQEIDRALNRIQNFDDPLTPIIEGEDFLHNDFEENIPEDEIFQPLIDVGDLHVRYHTLSDEQKTVFQKVKINLDGTETDPMLSFVSGSGGTGKSYLIDTVACLIASYSPSGKNLLLKAAPTGMSALNINATTIHRAFKLPVQLGWIPSYKPLSSKQLEELRSVLKDVKWIIIDEISMVSYQSLRMIHLRLCEAKNVEEPFGGLSVLVLGDLMQFKPIRAPWIFKPPSSYVHELNLWKLFNFFELHKNHRQTGDTRYLELLERLRFGQCTEDDLSLLQSRVFDSEKLEDSDLFSKFADALALYPTNNEVNIFNAKKTENLKKELAKINKKTYVMRAKDSYATGQHFDEPCPERLVPKEEKLTAGIPSSIEIGIGSRVMLRRNWSVADGLVNGSTGTVVGIKWTALRDEPLQDGDLPEILIVRFDGNMGGRHKDINGYVRVQCSTFEFPGNYQTLIKRRAFAIILCWALVFHKCQGLTLHFASIALSKSQFAKAMSYVILSRLKSSGGLHLMDSVEKRNILTLKKDAEPCDREAVKEIYRLRLMKIGMEENDIESMLVWITEYPMCCCCKKWVCACKCK